MNKKAASQFASISTDPEQRLSRHPFDDTPPAKDRLGQNEMTMIRLQRTDDRRAPVRRLRAHGGQQGIVDFQGHYRQ